MKPQQYCQDKAAKSGSSFYYSFLFLPPDKREALTALYAFCREIDDIVDNCKDSDIARTKLAWWRSEIEQLFANNPQHPVTLALHPRLEQMRLCKGYFLEIIDGMEMDLDKNRYNNFEELSEYCYRVAGLVGLLAVEIFGYKDNATQQYARQLGIALQLTNIIRDIREDLQRGRIYLPLDDLARFNVSVNDLKQNKTTDAIHRLLDFQALRAHDFYQKAFASLPSSDRYQQRAGVIMAEIYMQTLHEIKQDGYRVLEHRISLTPLRKLWIAWTSARREKKQFAKIAV